MMMKRVLKLCSATPIRLWSWAALALLVAAVPASAREEWPEHDFFFVRSRITSEGLRACQMLLSLNIEQRLFSLVWVELQTPDAPLIVNYMNADPRIALAERVVISIDGAEVLTFTPTSRSVEPEISTLAGPLTGQAATAAWEAMQQASANAAWLTVTAGKTSTRVPATGLRETLADFTQCRTRRNI